MALSYLVQGDALCQELMIWFTEIKEGESFLYQERINSGKIAIGFFGNYINSKNQEM